jgi:serine/threonine protein kinase
MGSVNTPTAALTNAMRFIRGDSLKEAIAAFHADEARKSDPGRRSLELRKLLQQFVDVCNAIEYARSRGVLHRDINPSNVIVGRYCETLMVDWGMAKALGRVEPGSASGERMLVPSSGSGSVETFPGSALGTPAYMSPEQAEGDLERLGPRSDVYSLGATLYCILTGRPAFEGDIGTVILAVRKGDFRLPRQLDPAVDPAMEAICVKAMSHEPADRYAAPRALAEDIERWMADQPVSAWREPLSRRARRWARQSHGGHGRVRRDPGRHGHRGRLSGLSRAEGSRGPQPPAVAARLSDLDDGPGLPRRSLRSRHMNNIANEKKRLFNAPGLTLRPSLFSGSAVTPVSVGFEALVRSKPRLVLQRGAAVIVIAEVDVRQTESRGSVE